MWSPLDMIKKRTTYTGILSRRWFKASPSISIAGLNCVKRQKKTSESVTKKLQSYLISKESDLKRQKTKKLFPCFSTL
jgi:hypothetical protein